MHNLHSNYCGGSIRTRTEPLASTLFTCINHLIYAPIYGTFASMNSATLHDDAQAIALFGKTRRAVLCLVYSRPEETFYLREITRYTGCGMGSVQNELKNLSDAGIILRLIRGKHILYKANTESLIYHELRNLILKTAGIVNVLRSALSYVPGYLDIVFICVAPSSEEKYLPNDIHMVVIGDQASEAYHILDAEAHEVLNRDVHVSAYTLDEVKSVFSKGNALGKKLLQDEKVFLVGDEKQLKELIRKS